jgi:hypothetical protein
MTTVVLEHLQHANSGSPDLTVGPDGNIGIGGVAAPSANLEIKPTGADGELKITSDANGGNNIRLLQGYNSYINASNNVYISAGGNTDMFNLVNGKVRIGAAGTGNELLNVTVAGRGGIQVGSTTGAGAYIVLDGPNNGDGSGGDYAYIEHDSTGKLNFNVGNSSNGVGNRMTIWPEGYVRAPDQPSFRAYKNSSTSAGNVVGWTGTFHNTGNHFNPSTGVFTAPITAKYLVSYYYLTENETNQVSAHVRLNGQPNNGIRTRSASSSGHQTAGGTMVILMAANDTLDVYVQGGGTFYGDSSQVWSGFSVHLIG